MYSACTEASSSTRGFEDLLRQRGPIQWDEHAPPSRSWRRIRRLLLRPHQQHGDGQPPDHSSATLPSQRRASRPRPCVVMTTRSALSASVNKTSTTPPSWKADFTGTAEVLRQRSERHRGNSVRGHAPRHRPRCHKGQRFRRTWRPASRGRGPSAIRPRHGEPSSAHGGNVLPERGAVQRHQDRSVHGLFSPFQGREGIATARGIKSFRFSSPVRHALQEMCHRRGTSESGRSASRKWAAPPSRSAPTARTCACGGVPTVCGFAQPRARGHVPIVCRATRRSVFFQATEPTGEPRASREPPLDPNVTHLASALL